MQIPFDPPFSRNDNFLGRESELQAIHDNPTHQRRTKRTKLAMYALTGTGGIGKTQLALEYAYQHETGYSAIFWVHGASASDMDLGFLNIMQAIVDQQAKITWPNGSPDYQIIGSKLGLLDCLAQDGSISNNPSHTKRINQAVHRWLSLPENSNWLFIFDNVDDLKSFKFETTFLNIVKEGGF